MPGDAPIEFGSLQVLEYAGDGRWSSEDDWWTVEEMKWFNQEYSAASARTVDPTDPLSRADWGRIDWARPSEQGNAKPSWLGKGVAPIASLASIDFGVRHPRPARLRRDG